MIFVTVCDGPATRFFPPNWTCNREPCSPFRGVPSISKEEQALADDDEVMIAASPCPGMIFMITCDGLATRLFPRNWARNRWSWCLYGGWCPSARMRRLHLTMTRP